MFYRVPPSPFEKTVTDEKEQHWFSRRYLSVSQVHSNLIPSSYFSVIANANTHHTPPTLFLSTTQRADTSSPPFPI